MRSEEEANRAIDRYADLVRRLCMVHLKIRPTRRISFRPCF